MFHHPASSLDFLGFSMPLTTPPTLRRFALILGLAISASANADDRLQNARDLLAAGQGKTAFTLLESMENDHAGDAQYDILFAIAANDSGQYTRSVFALERVLSIEPDNHRARIEMARAYLALGETSKARQELHAARNPSLPEETTRTIERYLDAVDRADNTSRTTVRGYLEGSIGYDNNLNAGPRQSSIAIPAFGGQPVLINRDSRANSAFFASAAGGVNVRHPVNSRLSLTAGLSGWEKTNRHHGAYDTASVDAHTGLAWRAERNTWSLTAQYNQFFLDDDRYRRASGLTAQWQHDYDARNQLTSFVQYAALDYAKQSIRDADRWVYGAGFAHALQGGKTFYASLYGIQEKEKAARQRQLGHTGYGMRLGAQTASDQALVLFASIAYETRRYGGEEAIFLKSRRDHQFDASIGLNWRLSRVWSLSPRAAYVKNNSNIALNTYDRSNLSLTLRRDF